jgi:diacylglycerol kinase family enzyme
LRSAERVACTYLPGTDAELRIFVEADGELVGTLPVGITMVPDALTLLVPPAAK